MRFRPKVESALCVIAVAVVVVVAGASQQARGALVSRGCGGTELNRGAMPAWTAPAMADSTRPSPWPFALSRHRDVTAMIFGYPLRAGTPAAGRQNKVLWIMRLSRRGLPLRIEARPLHSNRPVVRETEPADASPGQIYPSYVNVPTAGCWRITLRWAGHSDQLALRYS